ncbi:MAG: hypothetical protein RMM53_01080 [Bacteroidia bacterium]|nr:hypothetical protein [Bacteroidia bacterium]
MDGEMFVPMRSVFATLLLRTVDDIGSKMIRCIANDGLHMFFSSSSVGAVLLVANNLPGGNDLIIFASAKHIGFACLFVCLERVTESPFFSFEVRAEF